MGFGVLGFVDVCRLECTGFRSAGEKKAQSKGHIEGQSTMHEQQGGQQGVEPAVEVLVLIRRCGFFVGGKERGVPRSRSDLYTGSLALNCQVVGRNWLRRRLTRMLVRR